jgi:replicative DNA helicase
LEQDADVVLLLHRPEKYSLRDENGRSTKGILEIAHAKNRQIDSGQVAELYYSTELRRYLDPNK